VPEPRLPPNDIEAEEAVLGSLLLDGEAVCKVVSLSPEDFHWDQNREVFAACLELFRRNEGINQVTLAHELTRRHKLEAVGGAAFLLHLLSSVPTPLHLEHYANIVRRTSVLRRLLAAGEEIIKLGYEDRPDVDATLDRAEDLLFRLRMGTVHRDFVPLSDLISQYIDEAQQREAPPAAAREGNLPQVYTGFGPLDEYLGGLQHSDLVILGARPSLGKTSLCLGIAHHAAKEYGAKVAIFSLEMSGEAIAQRFLAAEADVDSRRLRIGVLSEEENDKVMAATGPLSVMPIYVDDTPQPRVVEIRSKARRLFHERGVDLIIVDYLQLIGGEGRSDNRVQEISQITRSLKALARELDVPVLAVSQLSRAPEMRTSHRPQLSDLRESGSIEQDADVVLFIHREDAYISEEEWERQNPGQPYPRGVASIIIAKHRNGPTGEVSLRFIPRTARFVSLGKADEKG
jgi:replicative DNA helicase